MFKNLTKLPAATPEEIRAFNNNLELFKAAAVAVQNLRELSAELTPFIVSRIATAKFPDDELGAAVLKFESSTQATREAIAAYTASAKSTQASEVARLSPSVRTAVNRIVEIQARLKAIPNQIKLVADEINARRALMREASMTEEQIDAIAPAVVDLDPFVAEAEHLNAELGCLESFMKTMDESLLPEGFIPFVAPKVSPPENAVTLPPQKRAKKATPVVWPK